MGLPQRRPKPPAGAPHQRKLQLQRCQARARLQVRHWVHRLLVVVSQLLRGGDGGGKSVLQTQQQVQLQLSARPCRLQERLPAAPVALAVRSSGRWRSTWYASPGGACRPR